MRSPLLWMALALHVVFASLYAWTTPHFEGPDEHSHYEYAWHIANAQQLPLTPSLQRARGLPQTEAAVLAHHPPLYYGLLAGAMSASGERDVLFAPLENPSFGSREDAAGQHKFLHESAPHPLLNWLRMTSVVFGALTIVCVYGLGRTCCPDAPRVADLAALLVACLPMWSGLHGLLSNDVLAATIASATLWLLICQLRREKVGLGSAALLGLLLGLAWLTKLTTLFLGGVAALAGAGLMTRRRAGWPALSVAIGVSFAVSGWWFVRNQLLHGDWLAMSAHDASFPPLPPELRWPYLLGLGDEGPAFLPELLGSLFGRFGWFSVPPHPALCWCGAAVTALAVLGLLRSCFDRERTHLPHGAWLLLIACVAVLTATAWFNFTALQPQSRLLFPAIAPAAVLLAAGLARISAAVPGRRYAVALLPATALAVFFLTFRPSLDAARAPAPADHRSMVGDIVQPRGPTAIQWTAGPFERPQLAPPTLTWEDSHAPAGTQYSLYAFDERGRVWLATHEWGHGALRIQGDALEVPNFAWDFLPRGVPLLLRLRRAPGSDLDQSGEMACSPTLAITRG